MAAPIVAGQAALVESAAPALTLDQTIKVLTTSTTKIGATNARYGAVDILGSVTKVR